jgi:hypothetical protein|tara:strand:- start:164 stop:526 length:363 start_codon:yes stop_codon:yes gene_type:complete
MIALPETSNLRPTQQRSKVASPAGSLGAIAVPVGTMSEVHNRQVEPIQPSIAVTRDYPRHSSPVFSPYLSPSTVTAETALLAKAGLAPRFQHNIAMTKIAKLSNSLADAPRFRKQIDILA